MAGGITKEKEESNAQTVGFRSLFSIRNYRLLILGQLISQLGDGVYVLALVWGMKLLTGSAVQMSVVLAADIIPTIILGVFAGVLVDRGNQKKFMVISDFFRGIVVFLLVISFWTHTIQPYMLIIAAVILSSFSAFFAPAKAVAIRTIVPDEQMTDAQSISSTIQTIIGLTAPALAGVLLMISLPGAFLFNAISFLVSLFFILFINEKALTTKPAAKLTIKRFSKDLKTGFKTIFTVPILRGLILYLVLINFMFAPVEVMLPLYVHKASQLGIIEVGFFVGILAGSLSIRLFAKQKKIVPMITGLCLILGAFAFMSFVNSFLMAVILIGIAGIGSTYTSIATQSLFMVKVPREILGRAQSTMRVLLESARPISLLVTGALLAAYSVSQLFMVIAIFGFILVVLMLVNPVLRKEN